MSTIWYPSLTVKQPRNAITFSTSRCRNHFQSQRRFNVPIVTNTCPSFGVKCWRQSSFHQILWKRRNGNTNNNTTVHCPIPQDQTPQRRNDHNCQRLPIFGAIDKYCLETWQLPFPNQMRYTHPNMGLVVLGVLVPLETIPLQWQTFWISFDWLVMQNDNWTFHSNLAWSKRIASSHGTNVRQFQYGEERHGVGWRQNYNNDIDSNSNNTTNLLDEAMEKEKPRARLKAVLWSKQHSSLLDARISNSNRGFVMYKKFWANNATNGLQELLPFESIPEEEYYTKYQVALVLGGIGAAFRTSVHLGTATAVVLQEFPVEEWFIPYMTPFEHYIPLAADLSNLSETMHWVHDNPEDVRRIARQGRRFYKDYLSFEQIQQHVYELLYRLALKQMDW